jgi:hypothetical protein
MKNRNSTPNILGKSSIAIMQATAWDYGGFHPKASYYNKSVESKKAYVPSNCEVDPPINPVKPDILREILRNKNIKEFEDVQNRLNNAGIPLETMQAIDIIARGQARQIFESNRIPKDIDEEPMDFSRPYTYDEWLQVKEIEKAIKQNFIQEIIESQEEAANNENEKKESYIQQKLMMIENWDRNYNKRLQQKKQKEKIKIVKKQAETIRKINQGERAFQEWQQNDLLRRKQKQDQEAKELEEQEMNKKKEEVKMQRRKQLSEEEYKVWKAKKDEMLKSKIKQPEQKVESFPYTIHDIFQVPAKTIAKKLNKRKQKKKKKKLAMTFNQNLSPQEKETAKPKTIKPKYKKDQVDENIHIFDEISSIRRIGDNSESGIIFNNRNQLEKVEEDIDIHNTSI